MSSRPQNPLRGTVGTRSGPAWLRRLSGLAGGSGGGAAADRRTERALGALAVLTLVLIAAMVVTVFIKAWPSFQANGLSWFGSGGNVDLQLRAMDENVPLPGHSVLYFRAWPLIWGTIITTVPAVLIALIGLDAGGDLPDRVRSRPRAPDDRTDRPAARRRTLGRLRPGRDPRARAVDRTQPDRATPASSRSSTSSSSAART